MFCKNCGTEFEDVNFCPECGTRVITNKFKLSRILLALVVIGFSIFLGIYGDNQFFGYSVISLYIISGVFLIIMVVIWTLAKKKPQISLKTIKQDFINLTTTLKGINELPDNYKNLCIIGYLSIILLFISLFLNVFTYLLYGGLNQNQEAGGLTVILLLSGFVLYFYSWTKLLLKLRKIKDDKSLRTHYNIISGFFAIILLTHVILSQFNII